MSDERSFTSDAGGRYLLLPFPETPDEFEMGMLLKAEAENLISPMPLYDNEKCFLSYDISDCISLKESIAERIITEEDLILIITELKHAADAMDRFLLDESNLLLDTEEIFVDKVTSRLKLCPYFSDSDNKRENQCLKGLISELLLQISLDEKTLSLCVRLFRATQKIDCKMFDLINEILKDRTVKTAGRKENISYAGLTAADNVGKSNSLSLNNAGDDLTADDSEYEYENTNNKAYNWSDETSLGKAKIDISELDSNDYGNIYDDDYIRDADIYGSLGKAADDITTTRDVNGIRKPEYKEAGSKRTENANHSIIRSIVIKVIITQAIMLMGLLAVTVLRGIGVTARLLPIYAILAACTALYFIVGEWAENKRSTEGTK